MKYLLLLLLGVLASFAQAERHTGVKEWKGNADQPVILFFSGDGGFNNFSNSLCQALNKAGYPILAIDSKVYFWKRKTPQELTKDMLNLLYEHLDKGVSKHFVLIGYSFGADVIPFLANSMHGTIKDKLLQAVMLEPSSSTDLEIHLSDLIGRSHVKRSMDVIAAINQMANTLPSVLLFGSKTDDFPTFRLHAPHLSIKIIPGDHHFDGKQQDVFAMVLKTLTAS